MVTVIYCGKATLLPLILKNSQQVSAQSSCPGACFKRLRFQCPRAIVPSGGFNLHDSDMIFMYLHNLSWNTALGHAMVFLSNVPYSDKAIDTINGNSYMYSKHLQNCILLT